MKLYRMMWLLLMVLNFVENCHMSEFNLTAYYQLPPLYKYDDYDRCLEEFHKPAVYCLVDSLVKPNATATLWPLIQEFSNDTKRSFRHDRLQRGLCMNRCQELMDRYDHRTQMKYFLAKFPDSPEIPFDPNTFRGALDWRNRYRTLANQCVNFELRRQYSLMAYSTVEYCTANRQQPEPLDGLDVLFLVAVGATITLVALSSWYDYRQKQGHAADHYRTPIAGGLSQILVAFSLPRNWQTLTARKRSTLARDLRFLQAVRFLIMYLVIAGHSMLFNCIFPLLNPQYVEMNYRRLVTMLIFNGITVIQTYFTISGFLLAVQFVDYADRGTGFSVRNFVESILYRYVRLMPAYAFVMLLDATWLIRLQDGPIWKRVAETERTFCRNNWWANALFVNNYVTVSEPCLQQSWYLATDFQLFIGGLLVLAVTRRFPRLLKPTLVLATVGAFLVPGLVTYVNRFDGVVLLRPEALKYVLWYDDQYRQMYIPAHTNYGSYLAGLMAGLMYHKLKRNDFHARQHKAFVVLWHAALPVAVLLLLSAYVFYAYDFEKPAVWIAMYAAIAKNLWGALFSILFLGLAFGVGWFIRRLLCNPAFRPLGKVTYCVYLCHLFVIRATLGNTRQPIYVSDVRILVGTSSTLVLAYIMGTMLCLGVEIPFSNLQKLLFRRQRKDLYREEMELVKNEAVPVAPVASNVT